MEHREHIENLDFNPDSDEESAQTRRIFSKHDPCRDTALHAMVCQRSNLKEARRIANNLIKTLLGNLIGMANECTDNAYISSSAMPSLLEYMISNLKEEELKPHL